MTTSTPRYLDLDTKPKEKSKYCEEQDHTWKEMRWQDAYPAYSGQTCTKCKKYRLQW